MDKICPETLIDALKLNDEKVMGISKMLAEDYGLDDDFLVEALPETVLYYCLKYF